MRTKISIILLFISLALLIIYGADVMAANASSDDAKSGFLHLNAAVRGGVLGGGAVILSIIAFAISFQGKIYTGIGASFYQRRIDNRGNDRNGCSGWRKGRFYFV